MSYQAIARKWRPTSFDAIMGQTHVTRTLGNAIALGRIHHAFLFTGARGVGKTSAARVLARALNCEKGPTANPCGVCPSCLEIATGSSPDVIEIDGASNNSVDDVRDLRDSVRYLPVRGKYKIYIVDEVHMLSKGAFNALLKTLEEPPAHVIFVFATTEAQKIPETILSRVQRFDFKRIPIQVVVERLQQVCTADGVNIPDAGLRLIARAGEGSMRDAQSLLDQVISFGGNTVGVDQVAEILGLVDRRLLYEMLSGILQGDADRCLKAIDEVYTFGYELSQFTGELLEVMRNATLVGLSPQSRQFLDVSDEERALLEGVAKGVPTELFVRAFQVLLEVHEQVARSSRPRLVLEMAVARLVAIRPARPLDHIVERIQDLERRLRQGGVVSPPRGPAGPPSGPTAGGGPAGPPRGGGAPPRAMSAGAGEPEPLSAQPPAAAPPPVAATPPPVAAAPPPVAAAPPAPSASPSPGRTLAALGEAAQAPRPEPALAPTVSAAEGAPQVSGSADQRYRALQDWLDAQGVTWVEWARHTALVREAAPVLHVAFADDRSLRLAAPPHDPVILAGLGRFFPSCSQIQTTVRSSGAVKTRAEEDREQRAREEARLRAELERHPVVRRVRDALGAEFVALEAGGAA